MELIKPKKRALFVSVLCFLGAIISLFHLNLHNIIVIDFLIFAIIYLLAYFLFSKIDIRIADILFYIIAGVTLSLAVLFNKSNIAFKLEMKEWEHYVTINTIEKCEDACLIKGRSLYDKNNNLIIKWHGFKYVNEGTFSNKKDDISYKISLQDNCIVKDYNESYQIINNKCK